MSKSPHSQSTYILHKLPKCSRCNSEFVLVYAKYDRNPQPKYEWECTKCHKVVPKELLQEEPLLYDDLWLQKWCKNNTYERKRAIKYEGLSYQKKVLQ